MKTLDWLKYIFSGGRQKSGALGGRYKTAWVEETFSFENKDSDSASLSQTNSFIGTSIRGKRISILFIATTLGAFIIFGRLFFLQIIQGDYNRLLAEGNRIRLKPIPAERGIFYDAFYRELVQNVPSFSLSIIPQDLPRDEAKREEVISRITLLSGVPEKNIYELLKKYGSYSFESLTIKENIDYESALNLYIQNADLPGFQIEKGTKRAYLVGQKENKYDLLSLSHLLGYLGKLNEEDLVKLREAGYAPLDNIGKDGLEKIYESELRGRFGRKKVEVDALGREQAVLAEESPQPGKNLLLTIDAEAQSELERLIRGTLQRYGKKRAVGIALNPQNGKILAMISWPSFNNNDFSGGISMEKYQAYLDNPDHPLFDRAVGGNYPPGSTIKPVIASAGLEEGVITAKTTVLSAGGIKVGNRVFKDWLAGGHGTTDVKKALAWSVNTFFYYVGGGFEKFEGLGLERISKYLQAFNFGSKTGIDLPGEDAGFVPTAEWKEEAKKERWYVGDTYNLSIGQGDLLVTPLQIAVETMAIANGGKIIQPHFLDKTVDTGGKIAAIFTPAVIRQNFIGAENLKIVRDGMRECVLSGSCQPLKALPFTSAGKTGTAQWNKNKENHAWFTAFAPFDNPQVAVTILIEEGKEGSTTALPVAHDFLAWWGKKYLSQNLTP